MSNKFFLGIDTSCYTTSMAVVDDKGALIYDGRIVLEVPLGGRGLRQSDAVFQHINNLGKLSVECFNAINRSEVCAVCASSKPRKAEDSYMPVFTVGLNAAKMIAAGTGMHLYEVSHQENHILAGSWSVGCDFSGAFMAYHISGGTTELLHVKNGDQGSIAIVGGSSDLKAGQFIDRVGVAMGMKFPCGQEMDSLCCSEETASVDFPISIDGCYTSFSGPETYAQRLIEDMSLDQASICKATFASIAKAIEKTSLNACKKYNATELLLVGGVTANSIIREYLLQSRLLNKEGINPYFAGARYSSDNAVGSALYGQKCYSEKMED